MDGVQVLRKEGTLRAHMADSGDPRVPYNATHNQKVGWG
jgi:hypothetical protein